MNSSKLVENIDVLLFFPNCFDFCIMTQLCDSLPSLVIIKHISDRSRINLILQKSWFSECLATSVVCLGDGDRVRYVCGVYRGLSKL